MCLRPLFGDTIGEIAHKPIKCYKAYYKQESGKLQSFVSKEVYDGVEGDVIEAKESVEPSLEMSIGFIHAYKGPYYILFTLALDFYAVEIALELRHPRYNLDEYVDYMEISESLKIIHQLLDKSICFCEMEIPAWERYWEGRDGDVCARKMVLKKRFVYNKSDILKLIQEHFQSERPSVRRRYEELIEKYKAKGE